MGKKLGKAAVELAKARAAAANMLAALKAIHARANDVGSPNIVTRARAGNDIRRWSAAALDAVAAAEPSEGKRYAAIEAAFSLVVERIDQGSGSPTFTSDEHEAFSMLLRCGSGRQAESPTILLRDVRAMLAHARASGDDGVAPFIERIDAYLEPKESAS